MKNKLREEFNQKIRNNFIQTHPTCQYCGKPTEHVHHLIPLACGGDNRTNNLIPLCLVCHGLVHGKHFNPNWKALQKAGIEKAKAEGKFRGGTVKKIKKEQYKQLKRQWEMHKITKTEFATKLNISRPTLNNILKDEEKYNLN